MDPKSFAKLEGCTAECAPTFDMLAASENPTTAVFDRFGRGTGEAAERPESSKCVKQGDRIITS